MSSEPPPNYKLNVENGDTTPIVKSEQNPFIISVGSSDHASKDKDLDSFARVEPAGKHSDESPFSQMASPDSVTHLPSWMLNGKSAQYHSELQQTTGMDKRRTSTVGVNSQPHSLSWGLGTSPLQKEPNGGSSDPFGLPKEFVFSNGSSRNSALLNGGSLAHGKPEPVDHSKLAEPAKSATSPLGGDTHADVSEWMDDMLQKTAIFKGIGLRWMLFVLVLLVFGLVLIIFFQFIHFTDDAMQSNGRFNILDKVSNVLGNTEMLVTDLVTFFDNAERFEYIQSSQLEELCTHLSRAPLGFALYNSSTNTLVEQWNCPGASTVFHEYIPAFEVPSNGVQISDYSSEAVLAFVRPLSELSFDDQTNEMSTETPMERKDKISTSVVAILLKKETFGRLLLSNFDPQYSGATLTSTYEAFVSKSWDSQNKTVLVHSLTRAYSSYNYQENSSVSRTMMERFNKVCSQNDHVWSTVLEITPTHVMAHYFYDFSPFVKLDTLGLVEEMSLCSVMCIHFQTGESISRCDINDPTNFWFLISIEEFGQRSSIVIIFIICLVSVLVFVFMISVVWVSVVLPIGFMRHQLFRMVGRVERLSPWLKFLYKCSFPFWIGDLAAMTSSLHVLGISFNLNKKYVPVHILKKHATEMSERCKRFNRLDLFDPRLDEREEDDTDQLGDLGALVNITDHTIDDAVELGEKPQPPLMDSPSSGGAEFSWSNQFDGPNNHETGKPFSALDSLTPSPNFGMAESAPLPLMASSSPGNTMPSDVGHHIHSFTPSNYPDAVPNMTFSQGSGADSYDYSSGRHRQNTVFNGRDSPTMLIKRADEATILVVKLQSIESVYLLNYSLAVRQHRRIMRYLLARIRHWGGAVFHRSGDCLAAVWNAFDVCHPHVRNATACGMEIASAFASYRSLGLLVGVVIHAGTFICGIIEDAKEAFSTAFGTGAREALILADLVASQNTYGLIVTEPVKQATSGLYDSIIVDVVKGTDDIHPILLFELSVHKRAINDSASSVSYEACLRLFLVQYAKIFSHFVQHEFLDCLEVIHQTREIGIPEDAQAHVKRLEMLSSYFVEQPNDLPPLPYCRIIPSWTNFEQKAITAFGQLNSSVADRSSGGIFQNLQKSDFQPLSLKLSTHSEHKRTKAALSSIEQVMPSRDPKTKQPIKRLITYERAKYKLEGSQSNSVLGVRRNSKSSQPEKWSSSPISYRTKSSVSSEGSFETDMASKLHPMPSHPSEELEMLDFRRDLENNMRLAVESPRAEGVSFPGSTHTMSDSCPRSRPEAMEPVNATSDVDDGKPPCGVKIIVPERKVEWDNGDGKMMSSFPSLHQGDTSTPGVPKGTSHASCCSPGLFSGNTCQEWSMSNASQLRGDGEVGGEFLYPPQTILTAGPVTEKQDSPMTSSALSGPRFTPVVSPLRVGSSPTKVSYASDTPTEPHPMSFDSIRAASPVSNEVENGATTEKPLETIHGLSPPRIQHLGDEDSQHSAGNSLPRSLSPSSQNMLGACPSSTSLTKEGLAEEQDAGYPDDTSFNQSNYPTVPPESNSIVASLIQSVGLTLHSFNFDQQSTRKSGETNHTGPEGTKLSSEIMAKNGILYQRSDRILGRGSFGCVYMGMDVHSGKLVAIKVLPMPIGENEGRNAEAEALIMRIKDPYIVEFISYAFQDQCIFIIMECMLAGSLQNLLMSFRKLPPYTAKAFIRDVLRGLSKLHSMGVVHRDVKPQNVLLNPTGTCKITDFGASAELAQQVQGNTVLGTPVYLSPEAARGESVPASDIWSCGIMYIQLVTGALPYPKEKLQLPAQILVFQIGSGIAVPEIPDTLDELEKNFVTACLVPEPSKRRTAARLLQSAMFSL